MKILITGGTGFIGRYLVPELIKRQYQVSILTRSNRESKDRHLHYLQWNGRELPLGIGLYDVVLNLAGENIGEQRWTEKNKARMMQSRIDVTRTCVKYINHNPNPPKLFISASAVGFYGAYSNAELDESAGAGSDFAAQICEVWEAEAMKAQCRTIIPRIGVVLGKGGGVFDRLAPIYKWYLGGKMGSGKQGFPWIHIQDIVAAMLFLIESEERLKGPINLVGPEIVDNATFSKKMAQSLGTKDFFQIPAFVLKLIFGEQADLFLGGQKVKTDKLQSAGFSFQFPQLTAALEDLVQS